MSFANETTIIDHYNTLFTFFLTTKLIKILYMYVFSSAFFFNKLIYYIYRLSHIIDRHDNTEKAFFPLSLAVTYIESIIINY